MSLTLEQLEFLRTPAAGDLLAMDLPAEPLQAIQRLRRHCAREEASAVATLRALRRRAAASGRFPEALAGRMLATDTLLQQASSFRLAVWKGRRFAERAPGAGDGGEVLDLCCGLGADAIGLARAGLRVRGIDVSPAAVLCATHNAEAAGLADRCRFELADVTALLLPADAIVHVDPDRRQADRRSPSLADGSPGEAFLRALPARSATGAMKLSPALDPGALVDFPASELEYVSEGGVCRQLLAWWGPDAPAGNPPRRRARVVFGPAEDPQSVSLEAGNAPPAPLREPGPWLLEPDPAVLAAGGVDDLAAAEGLWRIAPGLGWLFADAPPATPLVRNFRVLDVVPGRERDVARALRRLDAGRVEIKPRGLKLNTDALQRRLRGRGQRNLAVLWCRLAQHQRAFLCERASP